jgi:hypothetical protein
VFARRVSDRLSYSNVVATIALFIALGGASYAAVALPAHSVGTRQLKAGAVTPGTLGFPLGARSFTASVEGDLPNGSCRIRGAPPGDLSCKAILEEGTPLGYLHLPRPGKLVITAIATLDDEGSVNNRVPIQLALFVDHRIVDNPIVELRGGETAQVPLQELASVHAGANSVGFRASASYPYNYEGRNGVRMPSASIIVTALPAG